MTGSTKTGNQDFVILINKVEATIPRHKGGDTLAVLDQLDTDALPTGRVWLLGLDTNLFQDDAFGVRATGEWLFPFGTQVGFVKIFIGPSLLATMRLELTTSP